MQNERLWSGRLRTLAKSDAAAGPEELSGCSEVTIQVAIPCQPDGAVTSKSCPLEAQLQPFQQTFHTRSAPRVPGVAESAESIVRDTLMR